MCRKGRMFAPTKIWRRWHRKININQRRYAMCSALAATALSPLIMARGHRIDKTAEVPLVMSDGVESPIYGMPVLDVEKAKHSTQIRKGKGKRRNRRYVQKKGPLVIYSKNKGIRRAFRNLPGVELLNVDKLNLLKLAPGGHLGRFCIWTQGALRKLDKIYGTFSRQSKLKRNYRHVAFYQYLSFGYHAVLNEVKEHLTK